jgi:hypothetical protein
MTIFNPFDETTMPEAPSIDDEETPSRSPSAGKNSAAEQGLEVPMGWKPTIDEPVPVVRCKATSTTTGERCKRWSIRGTTVCQTHGGRLPNVIEHSQAVVESARLRLFGLAEQAVDVLEDLSKPGTSDQIRLKAAELILNRAGLKDAVELKVEVTDNRDPSEDILKKLQIMRDRITASEREELEELVDEGEHEQPEDLPEVP